MKKTIYKIESKYDHLINNLQRISSKNSIFNYEEGSKAFLSLGLGNIRKWSEILLPNTRIIIEPKIIGSRIGLQYINGKLHKVINENCFDITEKVISMKKIPKKLPITKRLELFGVLYKEKKINSKFSNCQKKISNPKKNLKFCAFHIFNCNINQSQSLQELRKLNFEIPETQITRFLSDIEIYRKCWEEGKLFQAYPTNGLVLKINSRKLQKYICENNLSIHWALAIN